ncbi:VIT domain-containing protein [Enhygromyxa salina]|nr:VIT domain-containing protein [Enhygromyxa salina]
MHTQQISPPLPRHTGARISGLRAGVCLSFSMLACTPFGVEIDDSLASLDQDSELVEAVFEPLPDDDRTRPVETHAADLRCFNDTRPTQAWEIDDPSATPETGMMGVEKDGKLLALPLQRTTFDTVVVGTVAETEIVQLFANPFDEAIEAVYVFPLHEHAAVDDYWLTIGERTIRGDMQTRAQARETYEDAKRDGRAAGLLEQERPNIFTQSVANIPPGQTVAISMHVVQPLEQDHGVYSLVLPTVVGPRFIPGKPTGHQGTGVAHDTKQVPDASRITPPIMPEGFTACAELNVSVSLESGLRPRALRSKFHDVDIRREGDVAFIELDRDAGPVLANRDFELSWDLGQRQPRAAIVAQPGGGTDDGYFTLTVQPPERVPDEQAVPRELVFVVDNSGSMGGVPLDTAKALMRRALKGMRPDDTFNVLRFSEDASGLSSSLLPATTSNIEKGIEYVNAMSGMGGTQMTAGIEAALDLPHEADRVRIVMFLTDGYIGNEAQIFRLIEGEIGDTRLFSLGVGGAPNRYLLDGMARVGRGAVTYAGIGEDIEPVVERFYERVATPVLTDIEIDWEGLSVAEILPGKIPDLFAGQPLTVFGRYQGAPTGTIHVRGKARGKLVELPVSFDVAKADEVQGVSSVWARNKVDDLLGYPALPNGSVVDAATEAAVVKLAIEYRIMTAYTSFVAVDEQRVVDPDGTVRTIVQPLPIPQGTTYEGFDGGLGLVGSGSGGGSGYGRGAGASFGGRGVRVPQVRQAKAQISGSLDRDIIRRIVRAHINEVRSCYNAGLVADPNLMGRVAIEFTIAANGKVGAATVNTNTTGNEAVGQCIAKAAKKWQFPKWTGGGEVRVAYPFNLSPG